AAKLVSLERSYSVIEKIPRISFLVAQKLEQSPVVFVGSRFGHYVDYRASGEPVLRVVLARVDLNLLNAFDGRRHSNIGILGFAIGNSLNEAAVCVGVHATQ